MKYFRFWLPVVVWMAVIFAFSARQKVAVTNSYVVSFLFFKTLHLIEYAFLFIVTYRATKNTMERKGNTPWIVAFIIVALYALTDEYHQTFIPSREGRLRDAIIDMAGAGIAWISIKQLLPKAPKKLKNLAKLWQLI